MISIIDYGLGNVKAFSNIFKMLNVKHEITANFDAIEKSSKLILELDHLIGQCIN